MSDIIELITDTFWEIYFDSAFNGTILAIIFGAGIVYLFVLLLRFFSGDK